MADQKPWLTVDFYSNEMEDYLRKAATGGSFETEMLREILFRLDADVNMQIFGSQTLLHRVVMYGDVDKTAVILEHENVDIDVCDNSLHTPLHLAVISGVPETVRMLLCHGATANVQDQQLTTPLHTAVYVRDVEAVRVLLEYDANFNLKDDQGRSPRDFARNNPNEHNIDPEVDSEILGLFETHKTMVLRPKKKKQRKN
jgi:ankyrin repeat protein